MSSAVTFETLAREGAPVEQAEYLKSFRADTIGEPPSRLIARDWLI
jgi:hypothetical protein